MLPYTLTLEVLAVMMPSPSAETVESRVLDASTVTLPPLTSIATPLYPVIDVPARKSSALRICGLVPTTSMAQLVSVD